MINLVRPLGHSDFSEDVNRGLSAVGAAAQRADLRVASMGLLQQTCTPQRHGESAALPASKSTPSSTPTATVPRVNPSFTGDLNLGHVLATAGIDPAEVVVIRHTYTTDGLRNESDLTPEKLLAYTRAQGAGPNHKLGKVPRRLWLCFMADGKRRSRFLVAYENHGEVLAERSGNLRFFDLHPSEALASLTNRLVVEWSKDAVNWAKAGESASSFPVVEIADPEVVAFPGYDNVLLSHGELQTMVEDSRYAAWRTALGSVQGIYLIADTQDGKLYVGKADGGERILGRWSQYAKDAHGGNLALKELAIDPSHRQHLQFSILRAFGPSVPMAEVDAAEAHFKRALLTRTFGLNRN